MTSHIGPEISSNIRGVPGWTKLVDPGLIFSYAITSDANCSVKDGGGGGFCPIGFIGLRRGGLA